MSYSPVSGPALIVRHTGQVFPLTQAPITIGRQADNTIALADPQVSRHHATLYQQGGIWFVQDLGSANGTYVNERRITAPEPLRHGYVLRVGNTLFDVQLPPAADETVQGPIQAAAPPVYRPPAAAPAAYPPLAAPPQRSALPWIVALLGIVVTIAAAVAVILLIRSSRQGGPPGVVIQSPLPSAQVVVGSEILLQATAGGASDITRLELRVDNFVVAAVTSSDSRGMPSLTATQPWTFGQAGPHTVSAVAYTARGQAGQPASVSFIVVEATGQATVTAPPPTVPPPTAPPPTAPPPTALPPTAPPPTALPPTAPPPTAPPPTATPSVTPSPTSTPPPTPTPTQTPQPVIQFWADATTIPAGGSTFLHWHVEHVLAIYLDGMPVTGPDGQQEVGPATTTTYRLRVVHGGGEETREVTITVTPVMQTWSHPIKVLDNRNIYYLRLTGPGEVQARAEWTGTQGNLALIINGPGQVGYYARQDGSSPLSVGYNVTAGDLAAGDTWWVTIASFGSGQATGTIWLTYPSGSGTSPFANEFGVQPDYGRAVNLIVLRGSGAIQAQATWGGAPGTMALIINGPGQVGYYARQDGSSPLSVGYNVTAGDLAAGDTWRVSLVSFSAANAEGSIVLTYP